MHLSKTLLRSYLALLSSLFLLSPISAQAGAWLQEEDQGEINLNYSYFSSDESFDASGNKQNGNFFSKNELNPYFEYGVDEDLTIGGSLSFQSIATLSAVTDTDNLTFSYFDIFARTYLVENDDFVISIEPRAHVPVNSDAALNPEGDDIIPELKLAFGAPFQLFDQYSFIDIAGTYRLRDEDTLNNELKDMIKLEGTIGLKLEKDIMLLGQVFHEQSLGRKTADNTPGNYDLTKLQASVAYDYWETVFIQLGAFSHVDGVNTSAGEGALFSLWWKF